MEIIILPTEEAVASRVADEFENAIRNAADGRITLGLATGSSPLKSYGELVRRHREESLSFKNAQAFLLDEYVGLPRTHEQSYYRFIRDNFTSLIDIADDAVNSPNGEADDPRAEAIRYDEAIAAAGGVDLQILGIGTDGHIGFNEPGSALTSRTRLKTLTEQTISDNMRFFTDGETVPIHVLTQGLGTISQARRIVLTATGEGKAEAIAAMSEGAVSAFCPASVLQLHQKVTVVIDDAAASKLKLADYYRFVQEKKPLV
ncbi:glucosamine-6-phosphate deaminase [Dermabacteraceae bacterium P13115]